MSDSCNLMGCSPPGSSVHGILQARALEWVTISFSVSCIGRQIFFTTAPPGKQETHKKRVQSLGWEDPLEEGKATHSSILAQKIPWTGFTERQTRLSD